MHKPQVCAKGVFRSQSPRGSSQSALHVIYKSCTSQSSRFLYLLLPYPANPLSFFPASSREFVNVNCKRDKKHLFYPVYVYPFTISLPLKMGSLHLPAFVRIHHHLSVWSMLSVSHSLQICEISFSCSSPAYRHSSYCRLAAIHFGFSDHTSG